MRNIVEFWQRLEGAVHPEDAPVFERFGPHGFNLCYPPPAYIGDVLNAPILILKNGGGFDPLMTPGEFPDDAAHEEFRATLASPGPVDLNARTLSPYYRSRNYIRMLESGTAAVVNCVAYRAPDGKAKGVKELTRLLPSARFHRNWLLKAVLPLVDRGQRFLVIHHSGRWKPAVDAFAGRPNVVFSVAPLSRDLTRQELDAAEAFLNRQPGTLRR